MNQQRTNGSPNASPTGYSQPAPPLTHSTSYSSQTGPGSENGSNALEKQVKSDSKYFFQPRFAKLGVKGNFMPLAAQPANADLADWLAHQSEWQPVDSLSAQWPLKALQLLRITALLLLLPNASKRPTPITITRPSATQKLVLR